MANASACHVGRVDYHKLPACSIRTVVIFPGPSDQPVRAQLESTCLNQLEENHMKYFALSYTWNDEDRDVDLLLNNQLIKVTKQLGELFEMVVSQFLLLCHMWKHCSKEIVPSVGLKISVCERVDQLCINQEDDEDKAQQVPRMRTIYEKAYRTMIWLRPCPDGIDLAMNLIGRLVTLSRHDSGVHLELLPLHEILGPETEDNFESWRALLPLMSHRYWSRTWILPEATANPADCIILIKCNVGLYLNTILWLRNVLRILSTRQAPKAVYLDQTPSSLVGRVENFGLLRRLSAERYPSLFQLLQITRRTECSRPEDKIFSMLPFAADVGDYMSNNFLKPSYVWSCQSVYTDLIKWYILRYKNCKCVSSFKHPLFLLSCSLANNAYQPVNFLGACTAANPYICQYPSFHMPSWIPNWTHASHMKALPKYVNEDIPLEECVPLYNACGPFSHNIDIVEPPADQYATDKIFVSGLRIAIVHQVLDSAIDGGFCRPEIEMSWQNAFDPDAKYPLTEETYQDAFDRTVVADVTRDFTERTVRRSGRVDWKKMMNEQSLQDRSDQNDQLKAATSARSLFFAKSEPLSPKDKEHKLALDMTERTPPILPTGCGSFMMGLGRSDVKPGDEVWALKGGQVLYILRRTGCYSATENRADTRPPGGSSRPTTLWLNGKSYPWDARIMAANLKFVGECYVHGLMDGEALENVSQPIAARPGALRDMASEFEEIFIGGEMRYTTELVLKSDEMDEWYDQGWKIEKRLGAVEDGSDDLPSGVKERVEMLLVL